MLANILLALSVFIYILLAKLLLGARPGGDYGVGYSFVMLIYQLGFVVSTGLLAWTMNASHCFDWLSAPFLRYRNGLVFMAWVSFVVTAFWSLEYHTKWIEGEFWPFLRWLAISKVYVWLPVLVFGACLYLVNARRVADFPPDWVRLTAKTGFAVCLLIALSVFWGFGKFWVQKRLEGFQMKSVWNSENQEKYKAELDFVETYNDSTIEGLLQYATRYDKQLRINATAKLKSFPNWENDLIAILSKKDLETVYVYYDNTRYVYPFLYVNKVEHPEKFIQAIQYSLQVLAIRAEKDLADPYALELGALDIELICLLLDEQFKNYAKEFRPGMLKLQAALATDAPERANTEHRKSYVKTLKKCRLAVKNWLDTNS
ncbi:MAG: hypothetical protein JNL02_06990 [Saprospiraceae bacterium]|nr:hypothetical protein [Saprospiraceae bacterium]